MEVHTSTAQLDGIYVIDNHNTAVQVTQNSINGVLDCEANNPAPTGFGNVATQGKVDQCVLL